MYQSNHRLALTALIAAGLLAGCSTIDNLRSGSDAQSAPAAAASGPKIGPGMDANGNVIDSRLVESGYGQKVKGLDDWEGEITGRPAPGSKFTRLKIGMSATEVRSILGEPDDQGMHPTGKAWIPFYFGSDKYRYETVYKGQGRLLFASSAGMGWDPNMHLIWIIHSAREGSQR
ncbi:MAG: hypothetical protein KGJ30_20380 [Burkholderiales bacterium]|nr:hypothetical protein [Burkholderiales bacterium]